MVITRNKPHSSQITFTPDYLSCWLFRFFLSVFGLSKPVKKSVFRVVRSNVAADDLVTRSIHCSQQLMFLFVSDNKAIMYAKNGDGFIS